LNIEPPKTDIIYWGKKSNTTSDDYFETDVSYPGIFLHTANSLKFLMIKEKINCKIEMLPNH